MSIASEITRLQTAKADLKTAIEGKGVTVSSSAKLDAYPALVESIQQGGGGDDDNWYLVCEDKERMFIFKPSATTGMWKISTANGDDMWRFTGSPFYFLYKGEKYYASQFGTDTKMYLSKTGQPINFGSLGDMKRFEIRTETDGRYYAWFEAD